MRKILIFIFFLHNLVKVNTNFNNTNTEADVHLFRDWRSTHGGLKVHIVAFKSAHCWPYMDITEVHTLTF